MKVLLTGASGFVGSHILESLREHSIATAILLRNTSSKRFLNHSLPGTEVRAGAIDDPQSLRTATVGVTHVIHCAGCTKALKASEFYRINCEGTANLIHAVNNQTPAIQKLIHISSLAAFGPATADNPAREEHPPHPVSVYGESKLAAEMELRKNCKIPCTIIRPPAVYGPRDTGFLSIFKAVKSHLLPLTSRTQVLSLVYVKDLAEAIVGCLGKRDTDGQTYFVAAPQTVTGRDMAKEVAHQMNRWTLPCPVPRLALWAVCLAQEATSRLTQRASLLNLQKYAELRAPGWVCSPNKLLRDTGLSCGTNLKKGIGLALRWYTNEHWL